jgi:cytochrome b
VFCVLGLTALGTAILWDTKLRGVSPEGKVLPKTVHVWFGYGLAANLAWRPVWAFLGAPFARCRAFVPGSGGSDRRSRRSSGAMHPATSATTRWGGSW